MPKILSHSGLLCDPKRWYNMTHFDYGGVSEWSMVQPWKGCVGFWSTGGSNPPPSANSPGVR